METAVAAGSESVESSVIVTAFSIPATPLWRRCNRLRWIAMSQYVLDHHLEGEKRRSRACAGVRSFKALNGESDLR
jgi:hypothetical protein